MELSAGTSIDLVPLHEIHPHELADATREQRIENRLRADGLLRDPLMVGTVPHFEGYVLLDGTNRLQALAALGLKYGLVQTVDYSESGGIALRTWGHAASVHFDVVIAGAQTIPGLRVQAVAELGASEALAMPTTLAVVLGQNRIAALTRGVDSVASRAEQLRTLVDLYEEKMTRVDCDVSNVEEVAQTLCDPSADGRTLIAFPPITRSHVVTMAMRGALIPAGITRHVIMSGRALRVNVPLAMLNNRTSLDEARARLRAHLTTLQPRAYREPTVLFDS